MHNHTNDESSEYNPKRGKHLGFIQRGRVPKRISVKGSAFGPPFTTIATRFTFPQGEKEVVGRIVVSWIGRFLRVNSNLSAIVLGGWLIIPFLGLDE